MKTALTIIIDYLESGGFDGLVDCDGDCSCELGDLIPCGSDFRDCAPGHKTPCDCGGGHDYHMVEGKRA